MTVYVEASDNWKSPIIVTKEHVLRIHLAKNTVNIYPYDAEKNRLFDGKEFSIPFDRWYKVHSDTVLYRATMDRLRNMLELMLTASEMSL